MQPLNVPWQSTARIASALWLATGLLNPMSPAAATHHFVNGNIISMVEGSEPVVAGELLVRDTRIAALGSNLDAPAGAVRIDLEGGYLLPGLTEMHAHIPAEAGEYRDEVLFLYVANGVTTARGMLGAPTHLDLKRALEENSVLGPRLITSGPSFNGRSVTSPEQAVAMVEAQVEAGYDFLKVHPGVSLEEYDAMAAAAARLGIRFAGHVPADVGLLHALQSGQASIDHMDGYVQALVPRLTGDSSGLFAFGLAPRIDEALISEVVTATRQSGAWVVPTETLLENFAAAADLASVTSRPQNEFLSKQLYENYVQALSGPAAGLTRASANRFLDLRKRLIRELHDGGVNLALGSDAPQIFNVPGFSLHRELKAMVDAGLSPYQALTLGTRNPARYFNRTDEFGTLAAGQAADLIWLVDNPVENIANSQSIRGVMVRGRWLDQPALDTRLDEIAARHQR